MRDSGGWKAWEKFFSEGYLKMYQKFRDFRVNFEQINDENTVYKYENY